MSNGDAKKKKIIIDGWVAGAALAGIEATAENELSHQQLLDLIEVDEEYLEKVRAIEPKLVRRYD